MKLYTDMLAGANGQPPAAFTELQVSSIGGTWRIKKRFKEDVEKYLSSFKNKFLKLTIFPPDWRKYEKAPVAVEGKGQAPYLSNVRGYGDGVKVSRTHEMQNAINNTFKKKG